MTRTDARTLPLDEVSRLALSERGLDYRLVERDDDAAARAYIDAETRGFLGGEPTEDEAAEFRRAIASRRRIGVYDEASVRPDVPVATINSWVGELTLPGDRIAPFWAISGVTVSPTRRRRGIARAMLEGELRTARDAGLARPLLRSMLTRLVSRLG